MHAHLPAALPLCDRETDRVFRRPTVGPTVVPPAASLEPRVIHALMHPAVGHRQDLNSCNLLHGGAVRFWGRAILTRRRRFPREACRTLESERCCGF